MRIGTWNLDNKWSDAHADILRKEGCDVWLLTEVNPRVRMAEYRCHFSELHELGNYWAAVLSKLEHKSLALPIPASAAVVLDEVVYCSTVLPWSTCKSQLECPWEGSTIAEMSHSALEMLKRQLPGSHLVWGGDWNQNLEGGREYVGSEANRGVLEQAIDFFKLKVPTKTLAHRLGTHTIDHIAVPLSWKVNRCVRVETKGQSDHDAYIVEVN